MMKVLRGVRKLLVVGAGLGLLATKDGSVPAVAAVVCLYVVFNVIENIFFGYFDYATRENPDD